MSRQSLYVLQTDAICSISKLCPKIIDESGHNPIDGPNINKTQIDEDKPLGFGAEIKIEPEIILPKYGDEGKIFFRKSVRSNNNFL